MHLHAPVLPPVCTCFPVTAPPATRCGPNYGSGNPVDEIDSCCRSHDLCYDRTAVYNHCSCDQQLVRCLNKIVDLKSNQLVKRAMRATIVTYFDNTACRCSMDTDMCMPVKNCICLGG